MSWIIIRGELKEIEIKEEIITFKRTLATAKDGSFGNLPIDNEKIYSTKEEALRGMK